MPIAFKAILPIWIRFKWKTKISIILMIYWQIMGMKTRFFWGGQQSLQIFWKSMTETARKIDLRKPILLERRRISGGLITFFSRPHWIDRLRLTLVNQFKNKKWMIWFQTPPTNDFWATENHLPYENAMDDTQNERKSINSPTVNNCKCEWCLHGQQNK